MTHKSLYRIVTPGPLLSVWADSIEAATDYAETMLPLKRGWTTRRSYNEPRTGCTLRAHNSKGRVVNGFRIYFVTHYTERDMTRARVI
jgi:hypothetical protein